MSMEAANTHGTRYTINVTPLIDVLLVLLIIFMVIQPTTLHGLDALSPHAPSSSSAAPDPRAVLVRIGRLPDGQVQCRVNQDTVAAADPASTLRHLFAQGGARTLFVQGESSLDYQPVLDVVNEAHAAGIESVGLLTPRDIPAP